MILDFIRTLKLKIIVAWKLGVINILRAVLYRFGLRFGWNRAVKITAKVPKAPFFSPINSEKKIEFSSPTEDDSVRFPAFGISRHCYLRDGFPDWHKSIITGAVAPRLPWWEIPDFLDELGDIKGVWEISRFDWLLMFARRAAIGNHASFIQLNAWLKDWCEQNPPFIGVNWKCGQEASIRIMHLAIAASLLGHEFRPAAGVVDMLRVHLERISPTIQYAIAQDNNHGTSEAAALFIGGSWLAALCPDEKNASRWMMLGRRWLENRARHLIEEDGSFSQYSLNYHRVMLDSYSMAEFWRRSLSLPDFSRELKRKLIAATSWLGNMVSPDGSDTPNLGVNDGARLLPLARTDHRDVRPSVQLASVLFADVRAYLQPGIYDAPVHLLQLPLPAESVSYTRSYQYDRGGYVIMRGEDSMVLLRYPRFRFRPGQSDLLHIDFWRGGLNLLRDAGSYSYNCKEPWQSYFPGLAAHNTIQFDRRDAMPKLSRFLYGAWPRSYGVLPLYRGSGEIRAGAGYRDWKGAYHHRTVTLKDKALIVIDKVCGFKESAILRWRLAPGKWCWKSDSVSSGRLIGEGVQLRITSNQPLLRCELVEGWESRYYTEKTPLPVLEIEIAKSGDLTSELIF